MLITIMESFANIIANTCYKHYEKLSKASKLEEDKEWTLLAAVLITKEYDTENSRIETLPQVISMATGSKCLGEKELSPTGNVINDSHAEILARRSLLRYLYHQINLILEEKESEILIFNETDGFILKPFIKFHLFISHTPCGDASIFSKENNNNIAIDATKDFSNSEKRNYDKICNNHTCIIKKLKTSKNKDIPAKEDTLAFTSKNNLAIETMINNKQGNIYKSTYISEKSDIYRTGAKCVTVGRQDPKEQGINYHIVGELRTKPGRGDPTLSMSCSDKIAKWNICGLQGALLSHFLSKPIYLSTIVIGRCPYNKEALQRAVIERTKELKPLPIDYNFSKPVLLQSELQFKYSQQKFELERKTAKPSPSAIIWTQIPDKSLEVAVKGVRQGVTLKSREKESARLKISKKELFRQFLIILQHSKMCKLHDSIRNKELKTYYDYKMAATNYQKCWKQLKEHFIGWTEKPKHLLQFIVENN